MTSYIPILKQFCFPAPRYRKDIYDRTWVPLFMKEWTQISTDLEVNNYNPYDPPEVALATAATPTDANAPLTIEWNSENPDEQYYYFAHFSEIENLQPNELREFNVIWNGQTSYGALIPKRQRSNTIYSKSSQTCKGGKCSFQLIRTNRSKLPPLLNACEVYTVIQFLLSETDESDGM